MNQIVSFIKEIFMPNIDDKTPIGLCAFECVQEKPKVKIKHKRKKEMRLSELMDK